MKEREKDTKEIVTLVNNLKEIVTEISGQVYEQGEKLDQIEDNVNIVNENAKKANEELEEVLIETKARRKQYIIYSKYKIIY
ncbi:MAG: hypothetical protein WCO53_15505 [Deltaproteobacteria bacterium]